MMMMTTTMTMTTAMAMATVIEIDDRLLAGFAARH
jgi:hypothetical protein